MLKAILFDLDHTLYDREASLQRMMPDFCDKVREYINDGVSFERFKELMIEAEHLHNYHTWKDRLEYMDSHGALKKYPDQEEYRYIFNSTMGPFCVNYDFTFKLLSDIRDMEYKTGYELASSLVMELPDITAMAGTNDMVALGIRDALLDRHYRIPEDISVLGCDNLLFSGLRGIDLTTVEHFTPKKGENACEILLKKIEERR